MNIKELQRFILQKVHENSGGVKFTELLVDVASAAIEGSGEVKPLDRSFPDFLEQTIEKMPQLRILRYGWAMGDDVRREKMFVYTPLEGQDESK